MDRVEKSLPKPAPQIPGATSGPLFAVVDCIRFLVGLDKICDIRFFVIALRTSSLDSDSSTNSTSMASRVRMHRQVLVKFGIWKSLTRMRR